MLGVGPELRDEVLQFPFEARLTHHRCHLATDPPDFALADLVNLLGGKFERCEMSDATGVVIGTLRQGPRGDGAAAVGQIFVTEEVTEFGEGGDDGGADRIGGGDL